MAHHRGPPRGLSQFAGLTELSIRASHVPRAAMGIRAGPPASESLASLLQIEIAERRAPRPSGVVRVRRRSEARAAADRADAAPRGAYAAGRDRISCGSEQREGVPPIARGEGDSVTAGDVLRILIDDGPEGMPRALATLMNAAMRLELAEFLGAAPYERRGAVAQLAGPPTTRQRRAGRNRRGARNRTHPPRHGYRVDQTTEASEFTEELLLSPSH